MHTQTHTQYIYVMHKYTHREIMQQVDLGSISTVSAKILLVYTTSNFKILIFSTSFSVQEMDYQKFKSIAHGKYSCRGIIIAKKL